MFIYGQRTGTMWLKSQSDDNIIGKGYSGKKGASRNNPQAEEKPQEGPIPKGLYKIGAPIKHRRLGKMAMPLYPVGHTAHGRTGFYIHGDNAAGDASTGCIIMPMNTRGLIAGAYHLDPDDLTLEVI